MGAMIMEAREEDAHPLPEPEKAAVTKPAKNRRKISMPWFRQSSFGMTIARLRLPRQHTIAAPDPLVEIKADEGCESSSWVTQDFTSSVPGQLTVSRGQQVEILEQRSNGLTAVASPDNMVLVRVIPPVAAIPANPAEGLVPASCIKMLPATSRSRREDTYTIEASNDGEINSSTGISSASGLRTRDSSPTGNKKEKKIFT